MGITKIGIGLALLGGIALYGSWAAVRAARTAEREGILTEDEAAHQRAAFGRVRFWSIRALLVAVWLVALGLLREAARRF